MKTPKDTVLGKIVDYDPETGEMTIKAIYTDWVTATRRQYENCLVQMIDSRPLSDKQRKACYAMLQEISEYTGMGMEEVKQWAKIKFLVEDLQETADRVFSLSNASMSLVCAFQAFLIDLILSWDIPTRFPLIQMVDDIDRYIYSCLMNKKCCVCGKPADLHHVKALGMGADRREIIHEGIPVLPLCRIHHGELHKYGKYKFNDMYHIEHGIPADKNICRVYKLKMNKDEVE